MHFKFALRPHRLWRYVRPLIIGEEKRRKMKKKIETTAAKYNGLSITGGGHKKIDNCSFTFLGNILGDTLRKSA